MDNNIEQELKEQYRQLNDILDKEVIVNETTIKRFMVSRSRMTLSGWLVYILCGCLILTAVAMVFIVPTAIPFILLTLLALAFVVYLYGKTPYEIELDHDNITIHLWIGQEIIPYKDIEQVSSFHYEGQTLRICGTNGGRIKIGWFWNSQIGKYMSYVTNSYESVLICMKSGKKYVISPEHSQDVIEAIRCNMEN